MPEKTESKPEPVVSTFYRVLSSGAAHWKRGDIITHQAILDASYSPKHWLSIGGIEPCEAPSGPHNSIP
jgi:hypothetical protein